MAKNFCIKVLRHGDKYFIRCETFLLKGGGHIYFPLSDNLEDLDELPRLAEGFVNLDFFVIKVNEQSEELCKLHLHETKFFEFEHDDIKKIYLKTPSPIVALKGGTGHCLSLKGFNALDIKTGEFHFPFDFSLVHPAKVSWKEQEK